MRSTIIIAGAGLSSPAGVKGRRPQYNFNRSRTKWGEIMDLDYHYGTVYVLSRWARFCAANANIIATSSQLVDDNIDDNPFSDAEEERNIAQGIKVRYSCQNVWGNVTGKGNCEVWIPFHFLPGLEGERQADKLICKKNSVLANKLRDRLLATTLDNGSFGFRLGVGLHVYADTWAHQEFAGLNNMVNVVKNLIFGKQGSTVDKMIDMVMDSALAKKINSSLGPLGHMAAVHCPDMPFLWWKSGERFTDGRKNWDEFLEASEAIYRILQQVSQEPVTGLTSEQQNMLVTCFKGIQSDDINVRYNEWLKRIHDNYFNFADFSDEDAQISYDKSTIIGDIDFRRAFYEEVNSHFDWVRHELKDNYGIDVLQAEPIY